MQISVDTELLEIIFTHATGVARIASYIDNAIVVGALNKSINEIIRVVAGLLGKPAVPQLMEELAEDDGSEFDVAKAVDDLCQLVARVDALANAAENLLDEMVWVKGECDRRQLFSGGLGRIQSGRDQRSTARHVKRLAAAGY